MREKELNREKEINKEYELAKQGKAEEKERITASNILDDILDESKAGSAFKK